LARENDDFVIKIQTSQILDESSQSRAIDGPAPGTHHSLMAHLKFHPNGELPRIVGSTGSVADLRSLTAAETAGSCDMVEIRLDLLLADSDAIDRSAWAHLTGLPLLFTARRSSEGGAGALDAAARIGLLDQILDDAALIDIEVASIGEMGGFLKVLQARGIPWVASCHDFESLPETAWILDMRDRAAAAGAAVFKAAARVHTPADLARLAEFQLAPHEIAVATMGMGPLAPVSRLLCAQSGSVLNYGYLGTASTAPGQWDCALLRETVRRLTPIRN
jgi:3-dehydroquinate dehydratase I